MSDPSNTVCNFLKKPSRNKNIRKRPAAATESSPEDSDSPPLPSHPPKKTPTPNSQNALLFSSSTPPPAPTLFHYDSSNLIQTQSDNHATASLETETAFDRDARAIRERVLKQADQSLKGQSGGENVYRGVHGYTDHKAGFRREQTVAGEKAGGSHGPLRASAHIRVSARFDFQPDICKDYKETGYCGFGDSCKFMHDRGDYKSGWQLERDWEVGEKARKRALAAGRGEDGGEGEEEEEGELPFACSICRRAFEDPVVTQCKHYFCEHCALKVRARLG